MSREQILNSTLFEFYATGPTDNARVEKLIGNTSFLLRELNNPNNIEVLTSNVCSSPAIWSNPDVLFTSKKVLECYLAAARAVLKQQTSPKPKEPQPNEPPHLSLNSWLSAVEKGLGIHSGFSRKPGPQKDEWKYSLVLAGVAYGLSMDSRQDDGLQLDSGVQSWVNRLATLTVDTANIVILHEPEYPPVSVPASLIALAVLPRQYIQVGLRIQTEFALPILEAMLGAEGLRDGEAYMPPGDVFLTGDGLIEWPTNSAGFTVWKEQWNRPLLSLLSQLLWLEAELVKQAPWSELGRFVAAVERMLHFSQGVRNHWEQSIFKEVELAQPGRYMTPTTYEQAWKLFDTHLSKLAVAILAPLKEIVGRLIAQRGLLTPDVARNCLLILNNIAFATQGRLTSSSFYKFVLNAAVDVLATSPELCNSMLQELSPPRQLPLPRVQRVHALFFFSIAESLGNRLPASIDTKLISEPAMFFVRPEAGTYLHAPETQTSGLELWESAHVAVLSLVANTHMAPLELIEPYLQAIVTAYPAHLNLAQLVVGFKTLVQVASPPYALSASFPDLPSVLMEVMHHRAVTCSSPSNDPAIGPATQAGCILAMVEALPCLPHGALREWLDVTYHIMGFIRDPVTFRTVDAAFRNTLSNMDPTRSIICTDWWTTGGSYPRAPAPMPALEPGVMAGTVTGEGPVMSGALGEDPKPNRL